MARVIGVAFVLALCCGQMLLLSSPTDAAATGIAKSLSSNSASSHDDSFDSIDTFEKLSALELQLSQLAGVVDRLRFHQLPSASVEKRRTRMREIHLVWALVEKGVRQVSKYHVLFYAISHWLMNCANFPFITDISTKRIENIFLSFQILVWWIQRWFIQFCHCTFLNKDVAQSTY